MKNVDGIRNHVQIQSNVPDEQLRQSLADRLRYDRVGYGIAFNVITLDVKDGVVNPGRHGARLSQQGFGDRDRRNYAGCEGRRGQHRSGPQLDV